MKIRVIPKPGHIQAVKNLYGREVEAERLTARVKLPDGSYVNLLADEWELCEDPEAGDGQ